MVWKQSVLCWVLDILSFSLSIHFIREQVMEIQVKVQLKKKDSFFHRTFLLQIQVSCQSGQLLRQHEAQESKWKHQSELGDQVAV